MSKYIDDIIDAIKAHPETFKPLPCPMGYRRNGTGGLLNEGIQDSGEKMLLFRDQPITINGAHIPTTWIDRMRVRAVIRWWYRTQPIKSMMQ